MRILATQYSIATQSFEIYLAGCAGVNGIHCPGCHNPDSWDFTLGIPWEEMLTEIFDKIRDFRSMIKGIWILGGEPLDQDHQELHKFLQELSRRVSIPLWLFTRKELTEIPPFLLLYFSYIKTGSYEIAAGPGLTMFGVSLATGNQTIHKLKD